MSDRYLIVGLGNPGKQYAQNRHNVGWQVLDELARRYTLQFDKSEKKAMTGSGQIAGRSVLLAKPQTYMNDSGVAVRGLVDFYKVDLARLLVIHDDLDIPLGTLRLRKSGGAGGQGGMKSIIQQLGTREFDRLRVGIGRPPGKMDPRDYVLQDFKGDDLILLREVTSNAADAVEVWLREGMEAAMTGFNGDVRQTNVAPQESDPEADLAKYIRASELAPRDPGPIEAVIGTLKHLGRLDEAADWHVKLADIFDTRGKSLKALAQLERAASLGAQPTALHRRIAAGYLAAEQPKKAINRLLILATQLAANGEFDAALAVVDEALAINPQHPKALGLRQEFQTKVRT